MIESVCVSHRTPSIAFTGFWFRLTRVSITFYYPFWVHKMLLLLFKKKKSWMTLAFTGVSHWLEPTVAWLRGSKRIPTALCSTPLYGAPWAIAVPVLVHKQRPAAQAELPLAVCSHWGMMWMTQHFPENHFCWWHTKPFLWSLLQSWLHLTASTQNPGVKSNPSQVAAAGWCEHGIFSWTGFAGVRQLSPEPEQVYKGLATCIASGHSWSSPHHLLTLSWPCSLVEVCWTQQNWWGWPEIVIPSCSFPQKIRRVKESILSNAYF